MKHSLEVTLENARKSYLFAVDGAWSQHEFFPRFSRGKCLRDRSYLRTLIGMETPVYEKAIALADQTDDKRELDIFLPEVMALAQANWEAHKDDPPILNDHSFHCALRNKIQCYIHIHNARAPKSFLDETADTIADFRYAMDTTEREWGCTELYTATWMNSCPRFLRFFPQEWMDHMIISRDDEIFATGGYQGQFINRKGLLNEKVARYFVENGKLMYKRNESYCSFKALRAHLDDMEKQL